MHIAYYDESGDDGFPGYSSPLFILTAIYLHYMKWKETYATIRDFHSDLRKRFKHIYLREIPIPDAFPAQRATIDALVNKLLDPKGQGLQVAEWEQELNELVYGLYRLTGKEIKIIEENVK